MRNVFFLALLPAITAIGCETAGPPEPVASEVRIVADWLSTDGWTTLQTATERQLRAEVYAGDRLIPNARVEWTSNIPSIISVDSTGLVRTMPTWNSGCSNVRPPYCGAAIFARYQNVEDATTFIIAPRLEFRVTPSSPITMTVGDSVPVSVTTLLDGEPKNCLSFVRTFDSEVITVNYNSTLGMYIRAVGPGKTSLDWIGDLGVCMGRSLGMSVTVQTP